MNRRVKTLAIFLWALVSLCSNPRPAEADQPSDTALTLAGLGLAIPTYPLVLMGHEGSHALMAKILGAKIVDYSFVPGRHPRTNNFFFAYVSVTGLKSDTERALFYMAPKMTNLAMLGLYSLLYGTDTLPGNSYFKLATLVFFTGEWVDFSRDVVAFWKHNDTVKFYNLIGLDNEWKRVPARFFHLTFSVATAYLLVKGFDSLFERSRQDATQMISMPIYNAQF